MKKLIYAVIILMLIQACKKLYDDPPVQAGISVLVVDGTITNDPPPYTVQLTRSVPYNQASLSNPAVLNANVSITDNTGAIEYAYENPAHSGKYVTSANGMRGQIGRSYKITILLSNSTYQSGWETMNSPPVVDSVYGVLGQVQTLLQNADGSYSVNTVYGVNTYLNAVPFPSQDYYYKLTSTMIQEYQQNYYTKGRYAPFGVGTTINEHGWTNSNLTITDNLLTGVAQHTIPITEVFSGFIPEFFSTASDTFYDPPYSVGAITNTTIYSVPKNVYQIFTAEHTQTVPSNSIFDPIPTQIPTNITCTNNSSQSVLGYFNAAATVHRFHYFLWTHLDKAIYSHSIDSLPPNIPPTGYDSIVPNFWTY